MENEIIDGPRGSLWDSFDGPVPGPVTPEAELLWEIYHEEVTKEIDRELIERLRRIQDERK
jgi:hypothetical protein